MGKLESLIIVEIYILFNFLLIIFGKNNKNIFRVSTVMLLGILTFQNLGVDLPGYKKMFEEFKIKKWNLLFFEKSQIEYSFRILMNLVKHYSLNTIFFIYIISSLNILVLYNILKNNKNRILYLYFYIMINFYLIMTNYLRQELSLLFFLAGIFLQKNKGYKSLLFSLSFLFHKSALILSILPIFLKYFKLKRFYIKKMIFFIVLGSFFYKIIYLLLLNYNGDNFQILYFRNYYLYFRKDIIFPTFLHKILFISYIGYPFFLNIIFLLIIRKNIFPNKIDRIFYKMMILGVYYSSFLIGLGIFSLGIFEIGMRSTYYFFIGNFYVIGNYINLKKNKILNIILISLIIKFFTVFVILQINRAIGIF